MRIWLEGLIIGLAYLAPIGLQNLFIINTALNEKFKKAILTAMIVTCFDISLALTCYYGVGGIISKFKLLELLVLLIGGLVVIYIGVGLLRTTSIENKEIDSSIPLKQIIINAFVVTWFNPQALIDGSILLGGYRVSAGAGENFFILGILTASILWFFGLTLFMRVFRSKINERIMLWINRVCGIVIIIYGIKLLFSFYILLKY